MKAEEDGTSIEGIVENQTGEKVEKVTLHVELLDANQEMLQDYFIVIPELEPKEKRNVATNFAIGLTDVVGIKAEVVENTSVED